MNDTELPASSGREYRKRYETIMQPVGNALSRMGFTANGISLLSLIVAGITALFFYLQDLILALVFFTIASFLDLVDGSVARANGVNRFGYVLDPVVDRYVEWFFLLGIMLSTFVDPSIVFFCFVGMIMSSYIRAKAESSGGLPDCSKIGIMERKEKLTIIGFGIFFQEAIPRFIPELYNQWPLVFENAGPLAISVLIVGIFSNISALQRLFYTRSYVYSKLHEKESE